MNKKKILIAVGVIFGVLILIALLLPLLVNVDRLRPEVQTQASAALGREVTIGKLELSIFSGGVTAKDIAIADDPAFSEQAFVKAKSLDVGVDLMPLIFSKALHVNTLTLEEPEIHLVKTAGGKWNYSSIGTTSAPAAKHGRGKKAAEPETKPAESARASAQDFSIGKLEIENGRVLVNNGNSKAHTYEDVNMTAKNISPSSVVPFTVSAKSPGEGKLKIEGRAGPLNREDTSQTPLEASIEIEHMELGSTGFLDPSSGIAGTMDFKGNIKSDGKQAKTSGNAKVDKLKLVKGGQPARQPVNLDYAADYDLLGQQHANLRVAGPAPGVRGRAAGGRCTARWNRDRESFARWTDRSLGHNGADQRGEYETHWLQSWRQDERHRRARRDQHRIRYGDPTAEFQLARGAGRNSGKQSEPHPAADRRHYRQRHGGREQRTELQDACQAE